jgi:NAD(P)-dependent dehydrogenase (short-subunit alcohol dehydrogenase family)
MTERVTATEAFQKKVLPRIPLRRWGTGDDFSGLAVYLASDASAYHTGDSFVIDGGYACF